MKMTARESKSARVARALIGGARTINIDLNVDLNNGGLRVYPPAKTANLPKVSDLREVLRLP